MGAETASTLHYDYSTIRRRVGFAMGLPRDTSDWDDDETQDVADILQEAIMLYYYPPRTQMMPLPHEWTFLRPMWHVTTVPDQQEYQLPPDFKRFLGHLSYTESNRDNFFPVNLYSSRAMNDLKINENTTGQPTAGAILPVPSTNREPQRWEIQLYPIPDAEYQLIGQYQADARPLSEDNPYPLGGVQSSYGVYLAALVIVERRHHMERRDAYQEFLSRLESDIAADLRRAPENMGGGWMHERDHTYPSRSMARKSYGLIDRTLTYNGNEL